MMLLAGMNSPSVGKIRVQGPIMYGTLFATSILSFCLGGLVGERFGPLSDLVAIVGDATCGWSWLLVRALFRSPTPRRQLWPLVPVLGIVAAGAYLRFARFSPATSILPHIIANIEMLVSSALLLLAAVEPLAGIARNVPRPEQRFRIIFSMAYATLLAITALWINGAPKGSFAALWGAPIKAGCALVALLGMGIAIAYRTRHPLPPLGRATRRVPVVDADGLSNRLLEAMQLDLTYRQSDLRVADLAQSLGTAEYRVTQIITGPLGFRNFNHMANHFRIEEAKRKLADPSFAHLPILTIALDCGFGSIGPFNRSFKAITGKTPMSFRSLMCQESASLRSPPAR